MMSQGSFLSRPISRKILSEDEKQKIGSTPNLHSIIENLCQELDEDNPNLLVDKVIDVKNDRDSLYVDYQKLYDIVNELQEELEEQDINQLYNCIGRLKNSVHVYQKNEMILEAICKLYDSSPPFIIDHIKADSDLIQTLQTSFVSKNAEIVDKRVKETIKLIKDIKNLLDLEQDSDIIDKVKQLINDGNTGILTETLPNESKKELVNLLVGGMASMNKLFVSVESSVNILDKKFMGVSRSMISSICILKRKLELKEKPVVESLSYEEKPAWVKIKEKALREL